MILSTLLTEWFIGIGCIGMFGLLAEAIDEKNKVIVAATSYSYLIRSVPISKTNTWPLALIFWIHWPVLKWILSNHRTHKDKISGNKFFEILYVMLEMTFLTSTAYIPFHNQ